MSNSRISQHSVLDLARLECSGFVKAARAEGRTQRLSGWADGIEVLRVGPIIYLPEFGISIVDGSCPEECIGYPAHLDMRLGIDRTNLDSPPKRIFELESSQWRDEEVAILGNPFSHVFGHWIEELFKVIILESVGFSGRYVLPSWYSSNYIESLELLNIQNDRICKTDRPTTFRNGILTTNLILPKIDKYPGVAVRLRELLFDAIGETTGGPERLWAVRGSSANGRKLINEEEIEDRARHYGFEIVDYATLSFRDQIALDRGAKVLAGPHGSALLHSAFLPDRSTLMELHSPNYVNTSIIFCCIFRHRYFQLVGFHTPGYPYAYGQDINIDMRHLDLAMSSL